MIYVCILCFILLTLSYICSNESIFAPAAIVSGIWFVCTFLYLNLDHGLYPVTNKFLFAISIWVLCFCFFSLLAQSLSAPTPFKDIKPSKVARDIYFYFSLTTLPFLAYDVYVIFKSNLGNNFFSVLRFANVQGLENQGIKNTSAFFIAFWLVSYVMELIVYSKDNRLRIIILFLMNLFYAFISLGKINFLTIFLVTVVVLYYRKAIKLKTIIIGASLLFIVFFGIQFLRSNNRQQINTKDFISLYLLAGIPAFETIEPASSEHFGANTFRFNYAINQKLGISTIEPENPLQEFTKVPVATNVYTVLFPYYKDFGLIGIVIFSTLLGLIFGFIFNMLAKRDLFALTLYSLLTICLVMQFMNDIFFLTLSQNIQYLIISFIPFFITKHQLFEKKS